MHAKGARRIGAIVAADDNAAIAAWRAAGYTLDGKVRRARPKSVMQPASAAWCAAEREGD
jgi:hypothetical protein